MRLVIILGYLVFLTVVGLACTQAESIPNATRASTSSPTASPTRSSASPIAPAATSTDIPKVSPTAAILEPTPPAVVVPAATPGSMPPAIPSSTLTPNQPPMTKQVVEDYVREGHSLSMADLKGLDLSGANLFNGRFQKANLSGANLDNTRLIFAILNGADLSNANLRGADLRFADLTGANLTEADLSGTDLREAILRDANLSRVDLSEAILVSANLYGADLTQTNLSGSEWDVSFCERSSNLGRFCTSEELLNAGALLCVTGNAPLLITPAKGSVQTRPSIDIDWSDCAGATEYLLEVQAPGGWTAEKRLSTSAYKHVSNALDACCSWSWRVMARVDGEWGKWSSTRSFKTTQTLPSGAPTSPLPLPGAVFQDGFEEQPSYTGDCMSPPTGSACIGFKDGYIWLVDELIQGKLATRSVSFGISVETELGGASEFHHILNTLLVKKDAR